MVNWKNFFLAGLILSVSPFSFNIGNYVFHYAILGYGLMMISLSFKMIRKFDIVLLLLLFAIIVTGIANLFIPYDLLKSLLLLLMMARVYLITQKKLVERVAFIALFIGVTFTVLLFINALGYYYFIFLLDVIYYLVYVLSIGLFIWAFQEIE